MDIISTFQYTWKSKPSHNTNVRKIAQNNRNRLFFLATVL